MMQPAPTAPPPGQPAALGNQAQINQAMRLAALLRRQKIGANNFYWVAVLSVVNSLISAFGGGVSFAIGLAATQIVDGLALAVGQSSPDVALIAKIIGLVLSLTISGLIALFGFFAGKGQRWAFITGMALYSLDALLMLVFTDWIGFAFHLYFLWGLFTGLQALNQLQKLMPPSASDFPRDIAVP